MSNFLLSFFFFLPMTKVIKVRSLTLVPIKMWLTQRHWAIDTFWILFSKKVKFSLLRTGPGLKMHACHPRHMDFCICGKKIPFSPRMEKKKWNIQPNLSDVILKPGIWLSNLIWCFVKKVGNIFSLKWYLTNGPFNFLRINSSMRNK